MGGRESLRSPRCTGAGGQPGTPWKGIESPKRGGGYPRVTLPAQCPPGGPAGALSLLQLPRAGEWAQASLGPTTASRKPPRLSLWGSGQRGCGGITTGPREVSLPTLPAGWCFPRVYGGVPGLVSEDAAGLAGGKGAGGARPPGSRWLQMPRRGPGVPWTAGAGGAVPHAWFWGPPRPCVLGGGLHVAPRQALEFGGARAAAGPLAGARGRLPRVLAGAWHPAPSVDVGL